MIGNKTVVLSSSKCIQVRQLDRGVAWKVSPIMSGFSTSLPV